LGSRYFDCYGAVLNHRSGQSRSTNGVPHGSIYKLDPEQDEPLRES
jgi:hypothetical protein